MSEYIPSKKIGFFRSLRGKLSLFFLGLSLLPLIAITIVFYQKAVPVVENEILKQLDITQQNKQLQVEQYLDDSMNDLSVLAESVNSSRNKTFQLVTALNDQKASHIQSLFENWQADMLQIGSDPVVIGGMVDLTDAYSSLDENEITSLDFENPGRGYYLSYYTALYEYFNNHAALFGYEDIYLIDQNGNIIFNLSRNVAFGSNLNEGNLNSSSLARLDNTLKSTSEGAIHVSEATVFLDGNALFMGTELFEGDSPIGSLVFQLPSADINDVLSQNDGPDTGGLSYLLFQDGSGQVVLQNDFSTGGDDYGVGDRLEAGFSPEIIKAFESGSNSAIHNRFFRNPGDCFCRCPRCSRNILVIGQPYTP